VYKIKHIAHKDIDLKKWDNTVLSSEYPLVFAQSFYLNATCPNWSALVIGDYESIFPLTNKTKLGFSYLPQPSFTSQLGVYGKVDPEIENLFYDHITKKFKLIEIELNASNKINAKGIGTKKTFIIDYSIEYTYNQNTKRNVKKAVESGISIKRVDVKDTLVLSKKLIDPFLLNDLKLSGSVVKVFNNLLVSSNTNNSLLTLKAVDQKNTILALAHFVFNSKHALYLKGTNFDKKENSGSMHLLIDTAIKHFDGKVKVFDFGGGSLNESLAGFYKGLGGTELNYSYLKINNLPNMVKFFKGK
jgi:hypothetical protein